MGSNQLFIYLFIYLFTPLNGEQYIINIKVYMSIKLYHRVATAHKSSGWYKILQCNQHDTPCIMAVYGEAYEFEAIHGSVALSMRDCTLLIDLTCSVIRMVGP